MSVHQREKFRSRLIIFFALSLIAGAKAQENQNPSSEPSTLGTPVIQTPPLNIEHKKITNRLLYLFSHGQDKDSSAPSLTGAQTLEIKSKGNGDQQIVEDNFKLQENPKRFRIAPYVGAGIVQTDYDQFTEKYRAGLQVEALINERFSVGLQFSYSAFDIAEISRDAYSWYYQWQKVHYGPLASFRQIGVKQMDLDLYGKVMILTSGLIRPYIAPGLGFHRTQLRYNKSASDSGEHNSYAAENGVAAAPGERPQDDGQESTLNTLAGLLKTGVEIPFSQTFGLQLEFQYSKSLANLGDSGNDKGSEQSINGDGVTYYDYSRDKQLLDSVGNDIRKGHQFSLAAGLSFFF